LQQGIFIGKYAADLENVGGYFNVSENLLPLNLKIKENH